MDSLVSTGMQWMLILMGGLFILLPFLFVIWKLLFRLRCQKAQGVVLRIEKWFDEELQSERISPVIAFQTSQGRELEIKPGVEFGLKYFPAVNSTVTVYYLPDTPERAQVSNRGLWEASGILILVGIPLLGFGFLLGRMP